MENGEIKTNGAVTVTDDYAVVVVDTGALQEFFKEGNNLDALYGVIEKKAKGLVADTSTKEGRSQIKTAARQIASVKTKVDDLGKQVVAELKALPKVIDNNRKKWREKLEALQEEIRRPVTEIEERQKVQPCQPRQRRDRRHRQGHQGARGSPSHRGQVEGKPRGCHHGRKVRNERAQAPSLRRGEEGRGRPQACRTRGKAGRGRTHHPRTENPRRSRTQGEGRI